MCEPAYFGIIDRYIDRLFCSEQFVKQMDNQSEQPDNSQIQPKICKSNHKQIQCEIYLQKIENK